MEKFVPLNTTNLKRKNSVIHIENNDLFATIFDENLVTKDDTTIVLISDKTVDFTVILRNLGRNIKYIVSPHTKGKITFLSEDEDLVINREFILEESSDITFLTPDFNRGNRTLNITTNLVGRSSIALWNLAAFSLNNEQRIYNISFNHYGEKSKADMRNYGVNINESKLVFTGSSTIFENVKGSETHQTARIIVFDKNCHAQADPILNIYHNDVIAASHAATVGQVNRNHLFYLTSRGVSEESAKRLITKGYLQPIIEQIDDDSLKTILVNKLEGVM